MPRFDTLPADQQAVLRLLLKQGTSYDVIARTLKMAPAAVRDRARSACSALGPLSTEPAPPARDAVIDYLLGQGEDATAAHAALSGSQDTHAWASAIAAELHPLSGSPLPSLPVIAAVPAPVTVTADPGTTETVSADAVEHDEDVEPVAADGGPPGSRTGGAILLVGAGILGALAIGFFVGRASKDDGAKTTPVATKKAAAKANVIGQANLSPARGADAPQGLGVAQFAHQGGKDKINVLVQGLPRITKGNGYGVWLVGKDSGTTWLGYFKAITTDGKAAAQQDLTVNPRTYSSVLITHQRGAKPTRPGAAVLSGTIQFPTS